MGEAPVSPDAGRSRAVRTPFADALQRVTANAAGSLHALPLSGGHSVAGSALRDKFLALTGADYLASEVSYSAPALDSFFRPRACLAQAQRLAATAFDADATLFVTGGTTLANTIALETLIRTADTADGRPVRLLVDRSSHQSIHFAVDRPDVETTYCRQRSDEHARTWADLDDLLDRYRAAAEAGTPFDAVVLTAAGYDGTRIDVTGVLAELLRYTETVSVLVDEAWSAIHYFHPGLRADTALVGARALRDAHQDKRLRMLVSHSAHKSMSALRQASYLHILGDQTFIDAAGCALYRHHTTSPSLPILASLDLARAQAELEGEELVERSLRHGRVLRALVATDPRLELFTIVDPVGGDRWTAADPTKVMLGVDPALCSGEELRVRLIRDHGLYVGRSVRSGLLLHLHIGVTAEVFDHLVTALCEIALDTAPRPLPTTGGTDDGGFLIAYPPGIPLTVPGERLQPGQVRHLRELTEAGTAVFQI